MRKIIVDIGHGVDTYPPSKGIGDFAEFTFNNAVGKLAKELAEINGLEVILTQPLEAKEVPLRDRINNINRSGAELCISIHANAGPSTAQGHEFWYWYNKTDSKKLATFADTNAIALLTNKRRGIRESEYKNYNFGILRETKIPTIIAEFGFFTNQQELKLLQSVDFQIQCAKVIVKTACDFLQIPFSSVIKSREQEIEIKKKKEIEAWKIKGLKELHEAGLVNDFDEWAAKIDENSPNWLTFALMNNIYQELKKKK